MKTLPHQTYKLGDKVFWIMEIYHQQIMERCTWCKNGLIEAHPERTDRLIVEGFISGVVIQRESDDTYHEAYGVSSLDENYMDGYVSVGDIFSTFNLAQSEFSRRYPNVEPIYKISKE
jgi:hypothetical protein